MYTINDKASAIRQIQSFLLILAENEENSISHLGVDGIFSEETQRSVRDFQRRFSLPVTGTVERDTFDAIYLEYLKHIERFPKENNTLNRDSFPLKIGDSGNDLSILNAHIREMSYYNKEIAIPHSDFYSRETESAVKSLQKYFREEVTGVTEERFFNRIRNEINERQKFTNG